MTMKMFDFRIRSISFSTIILLATFIQLGIGVCLHILWYATGKFSWMDYYLNYQGNLFFVFMSIMEVSISVMVVRQLGRGEPLRNAWFLIAIAATAHFAGQLLLHLFGVDFRLNPLVWLLHGEHVFKVERLRQLGYVVGGPIEMAGLACGLFLVLRIYKNLRFMGRLTVADYALIGVVLTYTLYVVCKVIIIQSQSNQPVNFYKVLSWANDPLLSVLLIEAVLIRRSVIQMGGGLIAKCWGAFTVAIFLTSLGSMGLWATSFGYLPWPESILTSYIWFLAAGAYALGSVYQLKAIQTASIRLAAWGYEEDESHLLRNTCRQLGTE